MKTYIHYGSKQFDKNKFKPIENMPNFSKPRGGFWASDVNAEFGWKEWNDNENFRECNVENSFKFTLNPNARIYEINSRYEAENMPQQGGQINRHYDILGCYPDFEKIVAMGYDAVEVTLSRDWGLYHALYGWDCDSILILNKDIVIPITEE